jgi:hypothetical protein
MVKLYTWCLLKVKKIRIRIISIYYWKRNF